MLASLQTSPLLVMLAALALLAVALAARAGLARREVRRDARADHAFRAREGMRGGEVNLSDYERAYMRVHGPRKLLFLAGAAAAIVVLTPLALRLADLVMTGVWTLSDYDRTFEPRFLVYQFGVFFLVAILWAGIAMLAGRFYHRGTVERVEDLL